MMTIAAKARMALGVALGGLLFSAGPTFPQSRADLVDLVGSSFSGELPGTGSGSNKVVINAHGASGAGRLRMTGHLTSVNSRGSSSIVYKLFEPDKVKRRGDQAAFKQGAFMFVSFVGSSSSGQTFGAFGFVAGCKGKAQVKGDAAKWQLSCGGDTLSELGLNAAQQAAFAKVTGSSRLKVTGRTP